MAVLFLGVGSGCIVSWSWLCNLMRSKDAVVSPSDIMRNTVSPWCELFEVICSEGQFDYPNSALARCKESNDSIYDTFGYFWEREKYNSAG